MFDKYVLLTNTPLLLIKLDVFRIWNTMLIYAKISTIILQIPSLKIKVLRPSLRSTCKTNQCITPASTRMPLRYCCCFGANTECIIRNSLALFRIYFGPQKPATDLKNQFIYQPKSTLKAAL